MIAVRRQYQVVLLPILGEIFLGVVNDVVCPKGARQVYIAGAAHGSDFSPVVFGNLHSKRPYSTRGPIDQDLLP